MKSVAWYTVDFDPGSGGHRTIFQNFNYLVDKGYSCDLYVDHTNATAEELRKKIEENYFTLKGNVFCTTKPVKKYNISIATFYSTAKYVYDSESKHKLYFAQDYEPWFFPMSESKIEAENSYSLGLKTVTIGSWLSKRIKSKFGTETSLFSFGADLDIYRPLKNIKKEKAICCVFQPDKPRRCANLVLNAAQIVRQLRPEVTIYLFGSEKKEIHNLDAVHLGILPVEELNRLYNRCLAGLCISTSNPSRIPFEMMASGLPVVDLYRENNFYDLPDAGCLLADATPEALASALIKIIDNNSLQEKLSCGGEKYMQSFPLSRGFEEFGSFIDNLDKTTGLMSDKITKVYTGKHIQIMPEIFSINTLSAPYITDIPSQDQPKQTKTSKFLPSLVCAKIKNKLSSKISRPDRTA